MTYGSAKDAAEYLKYGPSISDAEMRGALYNALIKIDMLEKALNGLAKASARAIAMNTHIGSREPPNPSVSFTNKDMVMACRQAIKDSDNE
jgi:hypothetical protein